MTKHIEELYEIIHGYWERNGALPADTTQEFLQLTAQMLKIPTRRFRRVDRW